jgi:hypothetical protein
MQRFCRRPDRGATFSTESAKKSQSQVSESVSKLGRLVHGLSVELPPSLKKSSAATMPKLQTLHNDKTLPMRAACTAFFPA